MLAGCSRATIQPGSARLAFERARVQVSSGGNSYRTAAAGDRLHAGDAVRVVTGEATLRLAHGATLLLRRGSQVVVGRQPELKAGDLVADVADRPLTVLALDSRVVVLSGATRVSTGLGLAAGVYAGTARVTSAARSLTVPAYRQVSIAAFGEVPSAPTPLQYRVTDRWDLHYLGSAVEIGEELQRRSDGFSAQLRPTEGRTPGFYSLLLPDLSSDSLDACPTALAGGFGQGRRPGEVLVGASLVLQSDAGRFASRCSDAFAFRDAGATWGLVALDLGVRSLPAIRSQLVAAIGRLPGAATIAAAGAATPPASSAPSTDVIVPSTPTPATPAPPASSAPAPAPTPVAPPPPPAVPVVPGPIVPPGPNPDGGLLTPVTDVVGNLLSGLLG
ncbi:MAG: hypothetical protein QOJ09_116 [Actinomycetota bacterium]|nr:hypothetical protein [Actinomycetota bacterium]